MSVDVTNYVILGYKLPYCLKDKEGIEIDYFDSKYLPMVEGRTGEAFSIIPDGMDEEYTVFGIILSKIDQNDSGFNQIDLSRLDCNMTKKGLKEIFNLDLGEPQLIIFTHYS